MTGVVVMPDMIGRMCMGVVGLSGWLERLTHGAINGTISAYGTNRKNPGDDVPGAGKYKFQ